MLIFHFFVTQLILESRASVGENTVVPFKITQKKKFKRQNKQELTRKAFFTGTR